MYPQRDEGLQPVGHRWGIDGQQLRDQLCRQIVGGAQRDAGLPAEHRGVDHEVQIVRAVERIEVQRPRVFDELAVGGLGGQVGLHRAAVIAAEHVEVAGHVLQMPGVGHQSAQQICGRQGGLGVGRHLHGVDVDVQQSRMAAPGVGGQCSFK